jgi:hypothetical protein
MRAFNNASSPGAEIKAAEKSFQKCLPMLHPLALEYRLLPNENFLSG